MRPVNTPSSTSDDDSDDGPPLVASDEESDEASDDHPDVASDSSSEVAPDVFPYVAAPARNPIKPDRRTAVDIDRVLLHNQRVKHSVYDRRSRITHTQLVRYDKHARTFVDDLTGNVYKTLNHMGEEHLLKVFGTPRKLSVWVRCQAQTDDDKWEYLNALYEQHKTQPIPSRR